MKTSASSTPSPSQALYSTTRVLMAPTVITRLRKANAPYTSNQSNTLLHNHCLHVTLTSHVQRPSLASAARPEKCSLLHAHTSLLSLHIFQASENTHR